MKYRKQHSAFRQSDARIAARWSAIRASEREFIDWLRTAGVRFMTDQDIEVRSIPIGRARCLVAIDGRGRWVADCPQHPLSVGVVLTQLFGEQRWDRPNNAPPFLPRRTSPT